MQPLRYINKVEAYVSRLSQLGGMDGFVAEGAIRNRSAFPAGKDEAEEIDRSKAAKRDEAVVDYFHAASPPFGSNTAAGLSIATTKHKITPQPLPLCSKA